MSVDQSEQTACDVAEDGHADDETVSETAASPGSDAQPESKKGAQRVSISVRTLVLGVAIAVVACAVCVLTWLYTGAEAQLDNYARQADNHKRAEKIALDYAVNAAVMNHEDLKAWQVNLVDGTSPELKEKLTKAAGDMEQILVPLKWNSTAKPLAAKVRSETGGAYVVDSFVSVLTKTTQAPEGLQSTATYSVTIDSNNDWLITDVGGIDAVVGSG